MFTGLVERVGVVVTSSEERLALSCDFDELTPGESVAVNGVCLTVAELGEDGFSADLSEETRRRTNLELLAPGDRVNLERAMPASGRFGGHLVQGHVDAVGRILERRVLDGSVEMSFSVPATLERYLVEKGSVTVNGVSLTVSALGRGCFSVALIPHTLSATTLGESATGDAVNIEVDILAKYVERLLREAGR